ncbi:IS200/IS605 family accessory protein TnpB-related protein [Streptomyces sp. T028]|uniref:IS200/IS605 family accessory protein TnpB-related protein n=1 Tax=Streptomyces sp. T028 TaxID=3394379 RepID=UPI003A8BDFD8
MRSAKQLLRKRARKESRHATHVNHKVAKEVVAVAQRTERGIALEELQGIRERVTVPRDQRARLSSWPFHQVGAFIAYKAKRAGVQPPHSGHFPLSSVRPRWVGRPRRRGQRARSCTLGVGIRQHARSGPGTAGIGGCDP